MSEMHDSASPAVNCDSIVISLYHHLSKSDNLYRQWVDKYHRSLLANIRKCQHNQSRRFWATLKIFSRVFVKNKRRKFVLRSQSKYHAETSQILFSVASPSTGLWLNGGGKRRRRLKLFSWEKFRLVLKNRLKNFSPEDSPFSRKDFSGTCTWNKFHPHYCPNFPLLCTYIYNIVQIKMKC